MIISNRIIEVWKALKQVIILIKVKVKLGLNYENGKLFYFL